MQTPLRSFRLDDKYWSALEALAVSLTLGNRTEVIKTSIQMLVEVLELAATGVAAGELQKLVER